MKKLSWQLRSGGVRSVPLHYVPVQTLQKLQCCSLPSPLPRVGPQPCTSHKPSSQSTLLALRSTFWSTCTLHVSCFAPHPAAILALLGAVGDESVVSDIASSPSVTDVLSTDADILYLQLVYSGLFIAFEIVSDTTEDDK